MRGTFLNVVNTRLALYVFAAFPESAPSEGSTSIVYSDSHASMWPCRHCHCDNLRCTVDSFNFTPPPPRAFSLPFAFSRQRPSRKAGDDVQYLSAVLATRPVPVLATISVLVLAALYSGNSSGDCSVDTKSL